MLILADQPLPEPENDAPDWTYEELIDTFVREYAEGWIEWCRPKIRHGIISEFSFKVIVEKRNPADQPVTDPLSIWAFFEVPNYRFWYVDKDSLQEIDKAEYDEIMADEPWNTSSAYGSQQFCFEDRNRYMIVHDAPDRIHIRTHRHKIGRDANGKLCFEESIMLGMA